jgi:hypothetical protein
MRFVKPDVFTTSLSFNVFLPYIFSCRLPRHKTAAWRLVSPNCEWRHRDRLLHVTSSVDLAMCQPAVRWNNRQLHPASVNMTTCTHFNWLLPFVIRAHQRYILLPFWRAFGHVSRPNLLTNQTCISHVHYEAEIFSGHPKRMALNRHRKFSYRPNEYCKKSSWKIYSWNCVLLFEHSSRWVGDWNRLSLSHPARSRHNSIN